MNMFKGSFAAFPIAIAAVAASANAQEKTAISITPQPGILYLASHVMETQKLIEKQAVSLGVHRSHRGEPRVPGHREPHDPEVGHEGMTVSGSVELQRSNI
jgi:ABC-type nitrate/sulfonate/bicarbonate transport system substrate-binding protein